jgi:hypothetical protein
VDKHEIYENVNVLIQYRIYWHETYIYVVYSRALSAVGVELGYVNQTVMKQERVAYFQELRTFYKCALYDSAYVILSAVHTQKYNTANLITVHI